MPKQLTMEARILIAFLLMGIVLVVFQYVYKPLPPPPPEAAQNKAAIPPPPPAAPPVKPPTPLPAESNSSKDAPGQIQAASEETATVETDLYTVVLSNHGAVARSWILKKYKDNDGKPLELVHQPSLAKVAAPFSVVFKGQPPSGDPNQGLYRITRAGSFEFTFEYSDGHLSSKKWLRFSPKQYVVEVSSEVMENGVRVPHSIAWRGGFGDATAINATANEYSVFYDLPNAKLTQRPAKDAKDAPVSTSGQYSFAGLADNYFAAVFLPLANAGVEITTFSDTAPNSKGAEEARVGAGVGGDGLNRFTLFVGPKDMDLLKSIDPKLEQLIDWGWFGIIAKPLFQILSWSSSHLGHNYGWGIMLVTVGINMLMLPLKFSTTKSSRKMQALQPQISAINEKYKSLSRTDPRKSEQQQETMALYKQHGVNPVGGCLPLLIQLPFLWAFYKVLNVSIEMRGAHWLWVSDLSQPESLPIHMLPVLMVITQFVSQKMTPPSPGMDPMQQKMMMFMPLLFAFMFYNLSAGLVLYWLTGNLVGIAQQWLLNRTYPAPAPVAVIPAKKKNRN